MRQSAASTATNRSAAMSSPERPLRVVLSPRARKDFIDILRFTGETWGQAQLRAYRDKLDEALRRIGRNPEIGPRADESPRSHRVLLVGSHVIVYRTSVRNVEVIRILHQRMLPAQHP